MRRQQKIHAIAIASISAVVIVAYLIAKPTVHETIERASGDRAIAIYEASWGTNCNAAITEAQHKPPVKNKPAPRVLALAQQNNVLTAVGDACNGRLTCSLKATSEILGTEPLANCFKLLLVRYRCYAYDRAWEVTTKQGETLTVDCHAPAAPLTKTP